MGRCSSVWGSSGPDHWRVELGTFLPQLQTELTWVCRPMTGPNQVRIIAQWRVGESRQLLAPSQVEKDKEKLSSFMQGNDEPNFV